MPTATTTVQVAEETWRKLNARRDPGQSFDDIIQSLLQGENDD